MWDLSGGGWAALIGIMTGLVALATVLARVIEKLVRDRKNGSTDIKYPRLTRYGNTTDLALQSNAIRELAGDIDELTKAVNDVRGMTHKDLPHVLERIEGKVDFVSAFQKEEIKEMQLVLRGLTASLDSNTSATQALRDFLVARTGVD